MKRPEPSSTSPSRSGSGPFALVLLLLLASCTSTVSGSTDEADDPAVLATVQQAEDQADEGESDSLDPDSEAAEAVPCPQCGPGPQPWHAVANRIRHHR